MYELPEKYILFPDGEDGLTDSESDAIAHALPLISDDLSNAIKRRWDFPNSRLNDDTELILKDPAFSAIFEAISGIADAHFPAIGELETPNSTKDAVLDGAGAVLHIYRGALGDTFVELMRSVEGDSIDTFRVTLEAASPVIQDPIRKEVSSLFNHKVGNVTTIFPKDKIKFQLNTPDPSLNAIVNLATIDIVINSQRRGFTAGAAAMYEALSEGIRTPNQTPIKPA